VGGIVGIASLAGCSVLDTGPIREQGTGVGEPTAAPGTDEQSGDDTDVGDAGAPTWTEIYTAYFAARSLGSCANRGCHDTLRRGFQCGTTSDQCYDGLVAARLLDTKNPQASMLVSTDTSPLSWISRRGTMPGGTSAKARADITAWVNAGALKN
jgi:hypothetical protein